MTSTPPKQSLPKAYDASTVESRLYEWWESSGFFHAEPNPSKKPFTIIQPPPNVTGELHLGHAQRTAVEDALTRYHRMLGEAALWLPGKDHAGIATQMVVERALAEEGLTRHDLGREAFVKRVLEWVEKYGGIIDIQHRSLAIDSAIDTDAQINLIRARVLVVLGNQAKNGIRRTRVQGLKQLRASAPRQNTNQLR